MATLNYQVLGTQFGSQVAAAPTYFATASEAAKYARSLIQMGYQNVRIEKQENGKWAVDADAFTILSSLLARAMKREKAEIHALHYLSSLAGVLEKVAVKRGLTQEERNELAAAFKAVSTSLPTVEPPKPAPAGPESMKATIVSSPTGR